MSTEVKESIRSTTLEEGDYKLKILVLGESMVGKTSLINRYTQDKFAARYLCTVGIDFQKKNIIVNEKKITLQIWDTAGQERYRNVTKNSFHTSQGFVLAYDITNRESFDKIKEWVEEIKDNSDENTKCILIATKCDLDNREVEEEEGQQLGKQFGYKFFETSAKENININEAFEALVNEIIKNESGGRKSLSLDEKKNKEKEKKECCK